jgi:hypothetical protein
MKTKNGNLTVKVGEKIIILSETDVFSGTNQTNTTDIKGTDLLEIIKYEEDIIELLLFSFEIELIEMVSQLKCEQNSPDVEIDFFFKRLFALLKQKPWITTLVFNKNINTKYREIEIIIFRMKSFLKNYLSELMNNGKKESISITIKGSNLLSDNLLSSLRK